jgi:hypothetical protein
MDEVGLTSASDEAGEEVADGRRLEEMRQKLCVRFNHRVGKQSELKTIHPALISTSLRDGPANSMATGSSSVQAFTTAAATAAK